MSGDKFPGGNQRRKVKRPITPELRQYLIDLLREERSLEQLYRLSHNLLELQQIRAEWKASYRSIRDALIAQEIDLEMARGCSPEQSPASENPQPGRPRTISLKPG